MYRVCRLAAVVLMVLLWPRDSNSIAGAPLSILNDLEGQANAASAQEAQMPPLTSTHTWSNVAKLLAPDGRKSDSMGYAVAMSGDEIVVGAPYATVNSIYAEGAAYVFARSARGWVFRAKLTASDGAGNAFFGSAVAISGDTVVVGADGVNIKKDLHAGGAYIFVKPRTGWRSMTQTAKLTASDEAAKAYLGSSIAIQGNTIAIGADGATVGANEFQGAVYIFKKPSSGWATTSKFSAKLTAADGARGDQFGYSLSMSADTLVVGARSAAQGSNSRQGAAYVFVKPAEGWAAGKQSAKLTSSDGSKDDQFGYSVSVDGAVVGVGAIGAGSQGAAYLFLKPAAGWSDSSHPEARLSVSDAPKGEQMGYSVSVSGDIVVTGSRPATVGANPRRPGSVYLFAKPEGGWKSEIPGVKLSPHTKDAQDGLGSALSLSADTLAVGAVDTNLGSKNKYQGAVYVFSREGAAGSKK